MKQTKANTQIEAETGKRTHNQIKATTERKEERQSEKWTERTADTDKGLKDRENGYEVQKRSQIRNKRN